jgi:hypothetical protein
MTSANTKGGLVGTDTVTGLSEAYNNPAPGTGKTLLVTGYSVNDGNSGNNFRRSLPGQRQRRYRRSETPVIRYAFPRNTPGRDVYCAEI